MVIKNKICFLALCFLTVSCGSQNSAYDLLDEINLKVNNMIEYTPDEIGKDYWQNAIETYERRKGDCEDYVILKADYIGNDFQKNLVVVKSGDEYHAVLEVITDRGTYYLDNKFDTLLYEEEFKIIYGEVWIKSSL